MARTFTTASSHYIGFTPQTFEAWTGITAGYLGRRNATGVYHTIYYAGANGGSVDGNIQLGITSSDDPYFGTNTAAARTLATTITATNQSLGSSKATGTATPVSHRAFTGLSTWTHANMSGTLANPATTATAIEEVGRWNGGADYLGGDLEWVGVWNWSIPNNEFESLCRIGPRFLPSLYPGCQRFWWFNQPISDTVKDLTHHGADQIAITGTVHAVNVALQPNLAGTVFSILPGVL